MQYEVQTNKPTNDQIIREQEKGKKEVERGRERARGELE